MDRIRQLFRYCEIGDCESVKAILDQGLDVDSVDDDDITSLHVSSANGNEGVVRLLIMRGAALDKINLMGWTPLMQASRHGHVGVVSLLLQHQADVNIQNRYGSNALTLASRGGHIQTSLKLLDAGAELTVGNVNGCEFNPLMTAALHGHDAIVRLLIGKGCDVNLSTPSTGITPLMLSALNGHMTTAQILIEKGGDPNLTNVCERTALEIAKIRGKREVRGYLDRKTTNKPTVSPDEVKPDIIEAAKNGDLHRVVEILNTDINQKDASSPQDGATPLMFAAMTGRLDMAELLLSYGCDINKQDSVSGWTALMQATYHGKKNVAMLLLNRDADVNIHAKNGCTAFDMASLIDDVDTELVRLLAAKAMQINRVDKTRKTYVRPPGSSNVFIATDYVFEDPPQTGLKGWWNRMSNRFRNLKLGRTLNNSKLSPLPLGLSTSVSVQDLSTTSTLPKQKIPMTPQTARVENKRRRQDKINITSYEDLLSETMKTHIMYTLNINPAHSKIPSETLKPVIPPFLPPPSFSIDSSEYSRRNDQWQSPKSTDNTHPMTPARRAFYPARFVGERSTGNHGNTNCTTTNTSPMSSGGASSIPGVNKPSNNIPTNANNVVITKDFQPSPMYSPNPQMPSTPGAIRYMQHSTPSRLFHPRRKPTVVPAGFKNTSTTTSPNSSTSGSSSITPQQQNSRKKSSSSKDSTTSTLTPSASPTPGKMNEDISTALEALKETDSGDVELSGILKKLSLEQYQPIFEQEEVDMEAFLTLTETDLEELGISQTHSRKQILTAITELNTGKGRERQQFHDTMTSFQSTLKSKIPSTGSENPDLTNWAIQEDQDPHIPSTKSRSS